jgi:hypothetical protein
LTFGIVKTPFADDVPMCSVGFFYHHRLSCGSDSAFVVKSFNVAKAVLILFDFDQFPIFVIPPSFNFNAFFIAPFRFVKNAVYGVFIYPFAFALVVDGLVGFATANQEKDKKTTQ